MSDPKIIKKVNVRPTLEEILNWHNGKGGIFHDPHESIHVLAEEVERLQEGLAKIANWNSIEIDEEGREVALIKKIMDIRSVARQALERSE